MKINTILLALASLLIIGGNELHAQESNVVRPAKNKFSLGMKLSQVQRDFGIGLDFTSPYFAKESIAFRLNTQMFFLDHINPANAETIWSPYFVSRLGVVAIAGRPLPFMRMYGEGGAVMGFSNDVFATNSNFWGGYGLFGFEFFMGNTDRDFVSYYIELGGTGTGTSADKVVGKPIYHNGFTMGTGFRFYL